MSPVSESNLPRAPHNERLSILQGPSQPELWETTVGDLADAQAAKYPDRIAVVSSWQSARLTYRDLSSRSKLVARAILGAGFQQGNCIGVLSGNSYQYLEIFLGGARIGCPVVTFNNTYSPQELQAAIRQSDCKLLFIAHTIGGRPMRKYVEDLLQTQSETLLQRITIIGKSKFSSNKNGFRISSYESFLKELAQDVDDKALAQAQRNVHPSDILNLQFTSGTTGLPKAASLTHRNLINNARFTGHSMLLTPDDVVCCPPPLFHCFGLVMGFLSSFCCGSVLVFPSDNFNALKTLDALVKEKATALLGVPTMFIAELEALEETGHRVTTVRTGLAAGSHVAPSLMAQLREKMQVKGMLIAYGMTETSPVTFITLLNDTEDRMFHSIGKLLPHTGAKIVDNEGEVVPIGIKGEICTSGFALQKGYWKNEEKTREVMKYDEDGVLWMHTGDEGFIDADGYGHITGRIKDTIIRGGENISPEEIEDCLLEHPDIRECCVVGLADRKYGEVVGCFLRKTHDNTPSLPDAAVRAWVGKRLGRIKEPKHIFWLGEQGVGSDLPKTGSGKYQKHLIRSKGNELLKKSTLARVWKL
ncbi:unnamed protein product [Clonostachys rosea f. rosea IK726]|uniref:AMP-dependent synthetase/ligase domain-containing protein n=2 Tax=Bionectria ochroleuca TaxID=29856 RepID=A0A0B7JNF7_BIOOC|nr:unnamed protein product [Clonostachys rosea f. rosea IK726]